MRHILKTTKTDTRIYADFSSFMQCFYTFCRLQRSSQPKAMDMELVAVTLA